MVASRQVENPLYRGVGRQRGRRFGVLAQVIGRTAIPFFCKYIVPTAKRVGADLLELALPEVTGVFSGKKNFKTAARSVGTQTLRKQLGSGSRKRTANRVIPTKSAKQISWSRRDRFTNISHYSCGVSFGTNFLWHCLEFLEGKSQFVTMSRHLMNKKFIQLPHLMKTA